MCGSAFLKNGRTFAILRRSGNIPVHNDWLIMVVRGCTIVGLINFKSTVEMLSWPELVFGLRDLITLVVSEEVIVSNEKDDAMRSVRKSVWLFDTGGFIFSDSSGPIFVKYLLNWLAILALSVILELPILKYSGDVLQFDYIHIISLIVDHVFFISLL